MTHRDEITRALRKANGGGHHEHIPVAEFVKAKAMGLTAQGHADFSTLRVITEGDI